MMNDAYDQLAATERSLPNSAERFPIHLGASMYLPKKIYEALPAAYISTGTLFILGAAYIGFGHWTMTGYLAVGLSCVYAGLTVSSIRRRQRSQSKARAR